MERRTGSVVDGLIIATLIFAIAIGVIMAQTVLTEFQAANTIIDAQYMNSAATALGIFDQGIVFITGAMYLLAFILAVRIPTSPVYFFPAVIFNLLATWVAAEFANVFWILVNVGDPVTASANQFPTLITLFENFPLVIGGMNFLLIVVMMTRIGGGRGGAAPV